MAKRPSSKSAGSKGSSESGSERRRHARFKVVPMYTTVHVRRDAKVMPIAGDLDGHLYDISEGGVRFELDEALPEGERVRIEIGLPGCRRLIDAWGKIVRVNSEDDDPGPRRMALMFDTFVDQASRDELHHYLSQRWLERAA